MKRAVAWGIVAVFLALGCGTTLRDKLDYSIVAFNEGVRWGRMQEVLPRIDPPAREGFLNLHRDWGRDLQVSGYDIINVVIDQEAKKAEVTVQVTWYRQSQMVERATMLVQRWEARDGEWLVMSEEFRSGDPF